MDVREYLILIRQEDKTKDIEFLKEERARQKIYITFSGNPKTYSYASSNVMIRRNPKRLDIDRKNVYVNMTWVDAVMVLDFGGWMRIFEADQTMHTQMSKHVMICDRSMEQSPESILGYFKEISCYTDENSENGFLKREIDKIQAIHPECVLGRYLSGEAILERKADLERVIFPFYFNLSQKEALENALTHSVSVIMGPPGTGKTQTILNIVANLIFNERKSVAVVSNNNEAVFNIIEKLGKKHYGFLAALLGRKEKREAFFKNPPIPKVKGWGCEESEEELTEAIRTWNIRLAKLMDSERRLVMRKQELRDWELEEKHFAEHFKKKNISDAVKLPAFSKNPEKILSFLASTAVAEESDQSKKLLYRIGLFIKYGIFRIKNLKENEAAVFLALQKKFYQLTIQGLKQEIEQLEEFLKENSFDALKEEHQACSEKLFRSALFEMYEKVDACSFTLENFKECFQAFVQQYPIILSTTFSLRQCIPKNCLLDYVIIDEASQVDLITAALVLSCCRNVVIVGDLKQLSQITDGKIEEKLRAPKATGAYDYFRQSILSSFIELYGEKIPTVTLREHYRCHPQIIEFCNQKYYDGKLIVYTKEEPQDQPLWIYKTAPGNHMRRVTQGAGAGIYNQREIETVAEEVLRNPECQVENERIGVVAPYRKQAVEAGAMLDKKIESDTVHKYQGREKETIIMSTVLGDTWYARRNYAFADDARMVNVAVSRAIRQFVLVTDQNFFLHHGEHIGDLIRYVQYHTLDQAVVESQIVSVFDLLYSKYSEKLQPIKEKMLPTARFQSEEALRVLLEEILAQEEFLRFSYAQQVYLLNLIEGTAHLTKEEAGYVKNRASVDFVLFYRQDKVPVLVIEVDGFAFHENNPMQQTKDRLKDSILEKLKIPYLRLKTNGSGEREKIEARLRTLAAAPVVYKPMTE